MVEKVTLREYFGLKRPGFVLIPESDFECYAARCEEKSLLLNRIQAAYDVESAPRLLIWGVYGGGKTHTEFFVGNTLLKEYGNDFAYIVCPDLDKGATFLELYKEIINQIELQIGKIRDLLRRYLLKVGDAKFAVFFANQDTANVCSNFLSTAESTENATRAWRWLSGEQVSPSEAISLGARGALSPRDAVKFLIKIGDMHSEITNRKIVLLIDECEKIGQNVKDSYSLGTFETAFREISEEFQKSLGFIVACTAADYDAVGLPFNSAAVSTRIGEGNFIQISLLTNEELKPFITDLLKYVVDSKEKEKKIQSLKEQGVSVDDDYFPFTEEAIKRVATYAEEDIGRKTPRVISDLLNDAATEAKKLAKNLIDEEAVSLAIASQAKAPRPSAIPRRRRGS